MNDVDSARLGRLNSIASLLLGAAHADGEFVLRERHKIEALLAAENGGVLSSDLVATITEFDPSAFDLESTCRSLVSDNAEARRQILRLVAEITLVDAKLDVRESVYLMRVGRAIGATPEDYADLTDEQVATVSGPR